jgi:hypothetical protein
MSRYPSLFIDKLAVTIPLDGSRGADVHHAVTESAYEWSEFISLASLRNRSYIGQYKFTISDGRSATLLLQPRNPRNNYFKLEYSPNNFGEEGRALLGEYLRNILGDGYLDDIRGAKLTRLDVTFDVRRLPLKDLLIVDCKGRKSSIIRGREGGDAETYYFPFDGKRQLCVYDKLQQIRDKQGLPPSGIGRAPWVRFEYRCRSLSRYTLDDVVGRMENPFNNFIVKQFSLTDIGISYENLRMFFDSCRLAGVDSTLSGIQDTAMRDSLALAYRTFPTPAFWQRRTSIWAGFRTAIQNALPA